mmetsp:Transcript_66436/g.131008  ORF Transcript_66436/g.131008 Transcript_66436/m.131008 type:complete len:125 (-) Transcript_66436:82-456(-)
MVDREVENNRPTLFPLASSSAAEKPLRQWKCKLCAQTRNTEDMENCKTCGRARGHSPERYRKRRREIRQGDWQAECDDGDEGSWGDAWGLIVGLILLVLIVVALAWAFYEDRKEALQGADSTEL